MRIVSCILALAFLTVNNFALACTCFGTTTVKKAIRSSDVVIVGKIISRSVIEMRDLDKIDMRRPESDELGRFPFTIYLSEYKILVSSVFKGRVSSDTLTIFTGTGGGDCGYRFEEGREYIVYGSKSPYFNLKKSEPSSTGRNIIWTNICTRTTTYSEKEISEIGKYRRKSKSYGN